MGFFSNLFGGGIDIEKVSQMLANGAVVIDVRTPAEFQMGHVAGSKNIPLNLIPAQIEEIKRFGKPVVLCCASGNRSGQACNFLQQQGIDCENGGGWMQVHGRIAS